MPEKVDPADFYRQEAERLRRKAASETFTDVRDNLLSVARQYDVMAQQAENISRHEFGSPFGRRHDGPNY